MRLNKLIPTLSAALVAAVVSVPAHAGYQVLDGWQLQTNTGTTTDIGRLNLVSGSATVYQEVLGSSVFLGARFVESGVIYSISYTKESTPGPLDVGPPIALHDNLTISFSNVAGHVDGLLGGGGFTFVFDSGTYSITAASGGSVSGSIIGLNGSSSSSSTISGATGATTLLGNILATVSIFDFKDSSGTSLAGELASGKVLFEATTNNQITGAQSFNPCPFDAGATCATVGTASAGDDYLVRVVPEPGTVALLGLSLGALGFVSRRRKI